MHPHLPNPNPAPPQGDLKAPSLRTDPGGPGRWCSTHQARECAKNRKRGQGPCHAPAIRGTDTCRIHAGTTAAVARAKGEARITAWKAFGAAADVDYRMSVLGVLQMTCLRLAAYSELLRRQVAAEGGENDAITEGNADSEELEGSGLIGHRYGAAGKDGIIYRQSEEVRALVALEAAERDRVVKYAKTAHDMGISDRLTNVAERWGDIVATRMSMMLGDLNLSPEQTLLVPGLISKHLGSIDLDAIGGSVRETTNA
jgi:hypothetical protein